MSALVYECVLGGGEQIEREVGVHLPNQTEEEWYGVTGIAMGGSRCESIPHTYQACPSLRPPSLQLIPPSLPILTPRPLPNPSLPF